MLIRTIKWVFALTGLLVLATSANGKLLLLGTLNHPQIDKFENIVNFSYQALGIDVEFISVSVERRLVSANDGLLDGIVAGTEGISEKYPNLIQIQPSLSTATIYLICLKEVECNDSVLFSENKSIITYFRSVGLLENEYQQKITANIIEIDRVGVTFDLLKHKRASYAVYTLDDNQEFPTQLKLIANSTPLLQQGVYHYIHKNYQHLSNDISNQLSKHLKVIEK